MTNETTGPDIRYPVGPGAVAAAVMGNALEFYDFTSYATFATLIGKAYFPAQTPLASLLLSVATFGVGFLTRPLGGALIGAYADRAGRKPAMLLTIALMATGMLMVACTPRYAIIGLAAPVLVVLARLVQGFALGGEVGPATAFLLEAAPPERRGAYASWQSASQGVATLLAGVLGVVLAHTLSPADMDAWGWRVPFILGVAIVPLGMFMRARLPETAGQRGQSVGALLATLARAHARTMVLALLMITSATIATYVASYMTTYALTTLHMPQAIATAASAVVGISGIVCAAGGGLLSDRVGRRPVMLASRFLLTATILPVFLLLTHVPSTVTLLLAAAMLAGTNSVGAGVTLVGISEALPQEVRSTGLSIAYAVAVTVFGGSTQLVLTWLIARTGNPLAPAWYLTGAAVLGLIATTLLPETRPHRGRRLNPSR